jgi:hypothetical protein
MDMQEKTPTSILKPGGAVSQKPLMRQIASKNNTPMIVVISILVVLAGVATGWVLSGGMNSGSASGDVSQKQAENTVQNKNEAGVADESAFPDTAEGTLVKGGIEGEGQFHLERTGGASQNVYLTSTVIDLASFEGKKVKVWGQSLSGRKAGWLMDVGKVKVVE